MEKKTTVENPGYKTSEFWMAVVGTIIPIANKLFSLELPEEAIYTIIAYILARSGVKAVKNIKR